MNKKVAIIIGGTSGIGYALIHEFIKADYQVGVTGRRQEKLIEIKHRYGADVITASMDVQKPDAARRVFEQLYNTIRGNVDIVVISAGVGTDTPMLDWDVERNTVDTNVIGFMALANAVFQKYMKQGHGHLVGISSIMCLRDCSSSPAYSASKAFVSNYMEGLRFRAYHGNKRIFVTDIRPGFVDTDMAQGEGLFWVASPAKAARQIFWAISRKKKTVYVTRRWGLIAMLMKFLPGFLMARYV